MAKAYLEVLAHLYADVFGCGEGSVAVDSANKQATDDGEIEGVERGFEGDNSQVGLLSILGQVHCANGRCGDVQQLPVSCLVCSLHPTDSRQHK